MSRGPSLERQIAELPNLDRAALEIRYRRLHGKDCARRESVEFLRVAVAYRLQKQLSAHLRARLYQVLTAGEAITSLVIHNSQNTILLREWKGTVREVTLVEDGAMYEGDFYKSLSKVAQVITNGKESGADFFGVVSDTPKDRRYGA